MAHLALVIDRDPSHRQHFVGHVETLFRDLPHADVHAAQAGSLACVWACGARAPVSVHKCDDSFAILIGYALDEDGRWLTAKDVADRWRDPSSGAEMFDGYHLGIVYDAARGLVAAVDPFGLFPLYFATLAGPDGGAFLVTSTPEAFGAHPRFSPSIDRLGLAGILLGHGPLDDRPLLAGVTRVATGHRLQWSTERGSEQIETYRLTGAEPPVGESFEDTRQRVAEILLSTIRRHRPATTDTSLLLSGGLDSRLVAACLVESGISTRAVILGRPQDYEVIAGRSVAIQLGLSHETLSTESIDSQFTSAAADFVRFGHLNAAPGADDFAEGLTLAQSTAPFCWSGVPLDSVFEPIYWASGFDRFTETWSFDRLLSAINQWGVPVGKLPKLLGTGGRELVDAVVEKLRTACHQGPHPPEFQASMLRWDQRIKNHVASALHRTAFLSWPLLPGTDRRLVEAVIGLPPAAYDDGQLEAGILEGLCPDLAQMPLDSNSFNFASVSSQYLKRGRVGRLVQKVDRHLRACYWQRVRRFDPRRYERLFNVDHPRWLAVRQAVEPLRNRLHSVLDGRAVDRLLPPPGVRTRFRYPVNQGSPMRLLMGLALWCDRA